MSRPRGIVLLAFGIVLLLFGQGTVGLVAPDFFAGIVGFMQTSPAIYAATAVRVAVGVVLLRAASTSRLPVFLYIFGGLVLLGGLVTPFIGSQLAEIVLGWWRWHGPGLVRLFAAAALVLGLVIAYAVAPSRSRDHES